MYMRIITELRIWIVMNEKVGKMKLSLVMQIKNADNGAAALATMLGYYGKYVSLRQMRDVCYTSRKFVRIFKE